jgi:hypothetical protein
VFTHAPRQLQSCVTFDARKMNNSKIFHRATKIWFVVGIANPLIFLLFYTATINQEHHYHESTWGWILPLSALLQSVTILYLIIGTIIDRANNYRIISVGDASLIIFMSILAAILFFLYLLAHTAC